MKPVAYALLLALIGISASAADVSGRWSGTFVSTGPDGQPHESTAYFILTQTGSSITGGGGPAENQQWPIRNGKLEGTKLTGEVQNSNGPSFRFSLMVNGGGDRIQGDLIANDPGGPGPRAKIDLTRVK